MRCYMIWDSLRKMYKSGKNDNKVFSRQSHAKRVAGRICGTGAYEIHCFKMERTYED